MDCFCAIETARPYCSKKPGHRRHVAEEHPSLTPVMGDHEERARGTGGTSHGARSMEACHSELFCDWILDERREESAMSGRREWIPGVRVEVAGDAKQPAAAEGTSGTRSTRSSPACGRMSRRPTMAGLAAEAGNGLGAPDPAWMRSWTMDPSDPVEELA